MKTNSMRAPLYKSAAILLVLVLLAYLTSAHGGGVLDSVGRLIVGAFRLVQWAFAMVIGVSVCIAALIGIFLFAVSLYDKEASATMTARTKTAVAELLAPVFAFFGSLRTAPAPRATEASIMPAQAVVDNTAQLKSELQTIVAGEVGKVTASQQALNSQFASLQAKLQSLEDKTGGFAAADQIEAIAAEISASAKTMAGVQEKVTALENKFSETSQKLQAMTPEKLLGDLPGRLEKLEQRGEDKSFDPQPLVESIEQLQRQVEEIKTVKASPATKTISTGKSKKKA